MKKEKNFQKLRADRLKLLIKEYGYKQIDLCEKPKSWNTDSYFSESNISQLCNGAMNLSEQTALFFIENYFPEERLEWLMGYTDFRTELEETLYPVAVHTLSKKKQISGIESLLSSCNYSFELNTNYEELFSHSVEEEWLDNTISNENALDFIADNIESFAIYSNHPKAYIIYSGTDRIGSISYKEREAFFDDIADYFQFKLEKLINEKKE